MRISTWPEISSDFPPWSHLLEEPPAAKDVPGTWIIFKDFFKDVRGIWVSIGIILITILYNILKLFHQGYIQDHFSKMLGHDMFD